MQQDFGQKLTLDPVLLRASSAPEDQLNSTRTVPQALRELPPLELSQRYQALGSGQSHEALLKALTAEVREHNFRCEESFKLETRRGGGSGRWRQLQTWSAAPSARGVASDTEEPDLAALLLEAIERLGERIMQKREDCSWMEELGSLRQAIQEIPQALHMLRHPAPTPVRARRTESKMPRYRPTLGRSGRLNEFPEVQLSVKFYQVSNVNTSDMTFEADFVCRLDWCDLSVQAMDDLTALDWTHYFNPVLYIENSKDGATWMDGIDVVPRRKRPDSPGSLPGSGLRKTMRFRGTLAMASLDLRCFPFDIQALPVRLRAGRCQGLALGTPAAGGNVREATGRVTLVDGGAVMSSEHYQRLDARMRGRGHYAVPSAAETLQEFKIKGITGHHMEKQRTDNYEVCIIVERPKMSTYTWDIVIQNLLVFLAASAFWDASAADLASRLSISLTVILTLAAYTSSRPSPIERAPYITLHDWNEQTSIFLTTVISFFSVLTIVQCGGERADAPVFMQEEYQLHVDVCEVGWCYSRNVDCTGLLYSLGLWVLLLVYSLVWLLRTRHSATHSLALQLLSLTASQAKEASSSSPACLQGCRRLRHRTVTHVEAFPAESPMADLDVPVSQGQAASVALAALPPAGEDAGDGSADLSPSTGLPRRSRPRPAALNEQPGALPTPQASPATDKSPSPAPRGRTTCHSAARGSLVLMSGQSQFGLTLMSPSPSPSPSGSAVDSSRRLIDWPMATGIRRFVP